MEKIFYGVDQFFKTSYSVVMNDDVKIFIQATAMRAKAYYYLFDEFSKKMGPAEALDAAKKAIYRLGEDKAKSFPPEASKSARKLAEAFVGDPIGSQVFEQSIVEADDNHGVVEMKGCPLVKTWQDMGLSSEEIKSLCDWAHQVDYGNIESLGYKLTFPARISCEDSSCILKFEKK